MRLVSIIKKVLFEKNMSSLISNVSVAAAGLASFMLLARQLDKAAFGDWVLYVALASFIDLLRFGLTKTSAGRLLSGMDTWYSKLSIRKQRAGLPGFTPCAGWGFICC